MSGEASRINGRLGGKPKGSKHASTIEKELERELLRQQVIAARERMTAAQIEHACGISYMILRNADGTFARATDKDQIDTACAIGAQAFQIFTQAPNPASYKDLMDRALDKPAAQLRVAGVDDGPVEYVFRWLNAKDANTEK